MIGIYDDHMRSLTIYQLETIEDMKKMEDTESLTVKTGSYG